jgi:hypothetical protein
MIVGSVLVAEEERLGGRGWRRSGVRTGNWYHCLELRVCHERQAITQQCSVIISVLTWHLLV